VLRDVGTDDFVVTEHQLPFGRGGRVIPWLAWLHYRAAPLHRD
jgi:hypothetical protein